MPIDSQKGKQGGAERKSAPTVSREQPEERLMRLGHIANITDYWRIETSSLLFTGLHRADQFVREAAGGLKKVLDGWDALLDKVREVRSLPKVKVAMDNLTRLSSLKNPWKLMSVFMSFGAIIVLFLIVIAAPEYYIIIVPVALALMFGLQFYSQRKLNKLMRGNIELMEKHGGQQIRDLSELCKDLTQNILTALRYELPKYGKTSDTFTLRLLSSDYSGVKLRVEERVRKRGRRSGDLYSVVWK